MAVNYCIISILLKVDKLTETMETLAQSLRRRARSPSRNRTCFNCGQEGHWKADCKVPNTKAEDKDEALNESGLEC